MRGTALLSTVPVNFFGLRSLRARLLLVAFAALLPLLGFFLYSRLQLRDVATGEVEEGALHRASIVAREYEAVLLDTRSLLATLARVPEVRAADPDACPWILAEIERDRSYRSAIGVIEEDGFARCMVPAQSGPLLLGDRPYFEEARRTGLPLFSTFHSGRITSRPVLVAAHPILEPDGTVGAVLAAGIELSEVSAVSGSGTLPGGTSVTVIDREGRILYRQPTAPGVVGEALPAPMRDSLPERNEGVFRTADLDGTDRVFGASALSPGGGPPAAYVLVGFSPAALLGRLDRISNSMLAGLGLAALTLFAGIAGVIEFVFLRRLRPLFEASRRLGEGDWSARTGLDPAPDDEVGRLASTFDRMAERLERRRAEESARAQEEIQEREERLRQVAEAADEVLWLYDPDTDEILYLSPGYERVFGLGPEGVLADPSSWLESVHPEDRDLVRAGAAARLRGEWQAEYRITQPDGSMRWIDHRTYPIRDGAGHVFRIAGVAQDITDRKRLEETLHQAGKLEAVGRLAGGVAHDFNNVLTAIRGHVQLLLSDLDDEDPLRQDLDEVDRASERAEALTRQLLAFSRKQALRPTVVSPARVVEELTALLGRIIGEDVVLETRVQGDAPPVRVDRNQLEQALINLAANARDAMPDGGRLTIDVEYLRVDRSEIAEGTEPMEPGRYVRIGVEDTGEGMEPEVVDHIFEPFFTTKPTGRGTGLGLAGLYGFVKQSGGYVRVDSTPGEGTRFDIHLPTAPEARADEERKEPGGAEGLRGTETVLVVEDEDEVRSVILRSLRLYGYRVEEASDPRTARELFRQIGDDVDLVLSDVVLPGMYGPELIRELRALRENVRVLFMAGYSADGEGGEIPPGLPSLEKPFTPRELVRKVRDVLSAPAGARTETEEETAG